MWLSGEEGEQFGAARTLTFRRAPLHGRHRPNGSGKSTLVNLLLGGIKPASGTVEVFGGPAATGNLRIGLVPQNHSPDCGLNPVSRSGGAGPRGDAMGNRPTRSRTAHQVDEVLSAVDAHEFAHLRFGEVSGGQQQRISIAQALIMQPKMLLLDEPPAGSTSADRSTSSNSCTINHDRGSRFSS